MLNVLRSLQNISLAFICLGVVRCSSLDSSLSMLRTLRGQYLLTCRRIDHHGAVAVSVLGTATCVEFGHVGVYRRNQLLVSAKDHLLALEEGARYVRLALLTGAELLLSLFFATCRLPLPIVALHSASFILTALGCCWELIVHRAVLIIGVLPIGCAFALPNKWIHTLRFVTIL